MSVKSTIKTFPDYTSVSETPNSGATKEQLARLYHRYHTVKQYATDKRILEVACGMGAGLGYLANNARMVVGGDYTENLLKIANTYYQGRIPILRLDGHHLPFCNRSFDLIFILEAIYYFADAEQFFAEAKRILDTNGTLLIASVNKDWSEFAPSPFSTRYFSVPELYHLLEQKGFTNIKFYGVFPTKSTTMAQKVISLVRQLAISLHLMPNTLEGRARLKRLFYGGLKPLPPEVTDGMTKLYALKPIPAHRANEEYKIIYCVANIY